jgi:hypothetical protein
VNLLQNQPELFGTYNQFKRDCDQGILPEYSFVEPNYNDHTGDSGKKWPTISIPTMTSSQENF